MGNKWIDCVVNKLCGFNLVTYSLLLMMFFVASSITSSVQTNNNYNSTPQEEWILVGGITSNSVTFRVRAKNVASERILVVSQRKGDFENSVFEQLVSEGQNADEPVQTLNVQGLESDSRYYYATMDLENKVIKEGSFSTPLPEGQRMNFTIAAAGCAMTGSKNGVFQTIAKEEPLFFVHLGDFHYEDIGDDDLNKRITAIDTVMGSPSQWDLFSSTALVYMWDDHDWLGDESTSLGVGRESGLASYRLAFPFYEPLPAAASLNNASQGEEVSPYHAFTIGTVRFIVLDLRSEATLTDIYSQEQKLWLFGELDNATAYDFVVLVSGKPWIGEPAEDDSWWGYPENRAELSTYISETIGTSSGPQNLIMVSSDAHMVAFDDGSNTYYGEQDEALSFPILQTGPLDRLGSAKGTAFTHGCHTTRYERNHQYSVIEFVMPAGSEGEPCMKIASYDDSRNEILSTEVCGKIFQSSDNAGNGSCSATTLTGGSWAVFGVMIGFLVLVGIVSCWFLKWRKGLAIFIIALVIGFGTLAVGIGIPIARNVPQFNTFDTLVIGMVQMITALVFVLLWIRAETRRKDDGDSPEAAAEPKGEVDSPEAAAEPKGEDDFPEPNSPQDSAQENSYKESPLDQSS